VSKRHLLNTKFLITDGTRAKPVRTLPRNNELNWNYATSTLVNVDPVSPSAEI